MSTSPIAREATQSQTIPSKRIVVHDANQMPTDYSSTPGGTIYSTTPGGTRIVYERAFLMHLRNSPISRMPPRTLPSILIDLEKPGFVMRKDWTEETTDTPVIDETSEQFKMDM